MPSPTHAIFILLASLVLTACGMMETDEPSGNIYTTPQIHEFTLRNETPASHANVATIRLEYVAVRGLENKRVQETINSRIREMIGMNRQFDGNEDLIMAISHFDIDRDILTIVAEGYYHRHGADNDQRKQVTSLVIDIETGQTITLRHLFQPGFEQELNSLVQEWLAKQDYYSPFESISDDPCFYWDKQFLYLCFPQYEAAPGSEGNITVPLSRKQLKDIIRPQGPM